MVDFLKDTLSKVNDWVKFAEAKNAANIAFCSASIFGVSRLTLAIHELPFWLLCYSGFVVVLLVLSLVISFTSFIPRLKTPWVLIDSRKDTDNLLYFGDACKYNGSSYLQKLYNGKKNSTESYDMELMYANQIVINSKVAFIKFKNFDTAVIFTISAILSPIGALIIYSLRD